MKYLVYVDGVKACFSSKAKTARGIVKAAEKALECKAGCDFNGLVSLGDIAFRRPNIYGRGPAYRYDGDCVRLFAID